MYISVSVRSILIEGIYCKSGSDVGDDVFYCYLGCLLKVVLVVY